MKHTLHRGRLRAMAGGLILLTVCAAYAAADAIEFQKGLAIGSTGRFGRNALPTDAIAARMASGEWKPPAAGDKIASVGGQERVWQDVAADAQGFFSHQSLRGGYLYLSVDAEKSRPMILEVSGYSMLYFNGEPRVGDQYQYGWPRLPVQLRQGKNELLVQCVNGKAKARLVDPKAAAEISSADPTFPDLIVGEATNTRAAVIVINTTDQPMTDLVMRAKLGEATAETKLSVIGPTAFRKVGFEIKGPAPVKKGDQELRLELLRAGALLHEATFKIGVRDPGDVRKETFVSEIDGSVQYYGLRPGKLDDASKKPAMFLTLHGASVEGIGQASAYASKSWGHLVAPTNRRPYGFDWEDWGRLDAMEVLSIAEKKLGTDPSRTYLTGHSMGGHGAWHLGVTFPGRFAAIGPSAGWVSFFSYAGGGRRSDGSPLQELLRRCMNASDTLALSRNLADDGVYVLHGSADDNVPVTEARRMREELAKFHGDFAYYEQPGAGHWWNAGKGPSTDCVDWPMMFDFFSRHSIPTAENIPHIAFTTMSPGVSADCHWIRIEQQKKQMMPSSVDIRQDVTKRRFFGTTNNVERLTINVGHMKAGEAISIELDGMKIADIPWPADGARIYLVNHDGKWAPGEGAAASMKRPDRCGPFKQAFNHRMIFVYGTAGSAEENAWAYHKARFDAEAFWYRGNGSIDVTADSAFDAKAEPDRSVILYGNAETNAAWKTLLGDGPVQVKRDGVRVGDREMKSATLACLFVRPRPGSEGPSVGAVCGTGVAGCRLTDRLPYFVSGVAYPDLIVIDEKAATAGDSGVRVAGFFGNNWGVESGEWVGGK